MIAAPAALAHGLAAISLATAAVPAERPVIAAASADARPTATDSPLPPTRSIGCIAAGPSRRDSGPRSRRVAALTFDDGPGTYTASVLDMLERSGVPGTFFVIGQQVRGRERLLRRMLAEGHALGNHTFSHANVSGGGLRQMRSTQGAVARATGYTPCVFRAPYGAWSGLLTSQARSLGMNSIGWTVDPLDWARPGSGAIRSRVLSATRPGAIILLHDGGGYRGQTLAALPGIIRGLRSRGYDFATVPELLGLRARRAPSTKVPPEPPDPRLP